MNNGREMMRRFAVIAGLGALALAMAAVIWQSAQAAEGWGLSNEKMVRFEAKAVIARDGKLGLGPGIDLGPEK